MTKAKFLYIVGRGHSGTTVLDAMLGNASQVESLGELISGLSRLHTEICSCGIQVLKCPYWSSIMTEYDKLDSPLNFEDFSRKSLQQANVKNTIATLIHPGKYKDLVEATYSLVQLIAGKSKADVIVDSSKEPTRAMLFRRIPRENFYLLHMVRDPVDVCSSYWQRFNKGMPFRFLRRRIPANGLVKYLFISIVAASWVAGNIYMELIKRLTTGPSILINYNELIKNPVVEMKRVAEFLAIDLSEVTNRIEDNESFCVGHNIGGNEFRHKKEFVFQPGYSKKNKMPMALEKCVQLFTFPLWFVYRSSKAK